MKSLVWLVPALALAVPVAPAAAQDAPGDKINMLDVYGDDVCPQSGADVITVCRRLGESERYRIPESLREDPTKPKNEAWSNRIQAYEMVGASGIASCSPVGVGGATGCLGQLIDAAYKEKREAATIRYGALIAAEREKRLATIDAEAAATQARVEQIEKEYNERIEREQQKAEDAAAQGDAKDTAGAGLATPPSD